MIAPVAGTAAVTYTISQPAYQSPVGFMTAINLDFTVPSLITTNTVIPASEVNSSGVTVASVNLSLISVGIDPGVGIGVPQVGPGIPWVGLSFGENGQPVFGEGTCFVPDPYGCAGGPGATPFDHLGTYTNGIPPLTLTIAPSSVPEPRFELAFGLFALLLLIGMGRRVSLYASC